MKGHTFRPLGSGAAVAAGIEATADASCFADEVVVDFPSVAAAVDRMRNAFLADERGASLTLAMRLSVHEARTGATVPLEVPVRCTCRDCGGRGETWTERCPQCAGSGTRVLRHQLRVSVPAGVLDGTRFYFTVTPRQDPPTRIELHVLVA
jgi:DnaJ-class molecular chaperone